MIAAKSEMDFFSVPSSQVSVKDGFWSAHSLEKSATDVGPYRIELPKDYFYYVLSKNYIQLKLKIVRGDGTPLQETDHVGTINLLGKTFLNELLL